MDTRRSVRPLLGVEHRLWATQTDTRADGRNTHVDAHTHVHKQAPIDSEGGFFFLYPFFFFTRFFSSPSHLQHFFFFPYLSPLPFLSFPSPFLFLTTPLSLFLPLPLLPPPPLPTPPAPRLLTSAKRSRVENGQVVVLEGVVELSDVVAVGTSQRP